MLELVTTHVQGSFKLLHSEMKSVLLYTFIIISAAGGYNLIIFYILLFDILPIFPRQYALQPPPACSLLHTYTKTSYILYTCTGNINVSLTMQSSQFPFFEVPWLHESDAIIP